LRRKGNAGAGKGAKGIPKNTPQRLGCKSTLSVRAFVMGEEIVSVFELTPHTLDDHPSYRDVVEDIPLGPAQAYLNTVRPTCRIPLPLTVYFLS
jgi:hypothetical protein